MKNITAAQLYYVTNIYPEDVTHEEAIGVYNERITEESDKSHWEAAAKAITKLVINDSEESHNFSLTKYTLPEGRTITSYEFNSFLEEAQKESTKPTDVAKYMMDKLDVSYSEYTLLVQAFK